MKIFNKSMYLLTACCVLSAQLSQFGVAQAKEVVLSRAGMQVSLEGDFTFDFLGSILSSKVTEKLSSSKSWFGGEILGGGRLEVHQYVHHLLSVRMGLNFRIDNSERYNGTLLEVQGSKWTNTIPGSEEAVLPKKEDKYKPILRMPGGEYYRYFPYFNNNYNALSIRLDKTYTPKAELVLSGFEIAASSYLFGSVSINDYRSAGTIAAAAFAPESVTPASDNFRYMNLLATGGVTIDPGILDKGLRIGLSHTLPVPVIGGEVFVAASYTFATFQGLKNFAQDRTKTINYLGDLMKKYHSSRGHEWKDDYTGPEPIKDSEANMKSFEDDITFMNHSRMAWSLGAVYAGSYGPYEYSAGAGFNYFGKTILEQGLSTDDQGKIHGFYSFSLGGRFGFAGLKFGLGANFVSFPIAWQAFVEKKDSAADDVVLINGEKVTAPTAYKHVNNELRMLTRPSHLRLDLAGSAKYELPFAPLTVGARVTATWVSTCATAGQSDTVYAADSQKIKCFEKASDLEQTDLEQSTFSSYKLTTEEADAAAGTKLYFSAYEIEVGAEYKFSKNLLSFLGVRFGYDNGVTMYPEKNVAQGGRKTPLAFGVFGGVNFVI